jgi:CheY-specific phosphatase CheX
VARHALFIERIAGPLNDLSPLMRTLGYQVARVSDPEAIGKLLRMLRRLSVVVINCDTLKADCAQLVTLVKNQHPDLPIAGFAQDPNSKLLPKAMLEFVTSELDAMQNWLASRVQGEVYSAALVQRLLADFQALLGSFGMPTHPSEPCLKSSLTRLSEVNALVSFGSERVSGHLILGASVSDMASVYRTHVGRTRFPGHEDLEDLLGEVANQAIGQVKRAIGADGSRNGLPYFVRGEGAALRHKAAAPSLEFEFKQSGARVLVELCVRNFDGGTIHVADGVSQITPGELTLL